MHRFAPILLALVLAACTSSTTDGGPSTTRTPDTGADTAARDTAPDAPDRSDVPPSCACDTESRCCDGCYVRHVGDACEDGLDCTTGTTCQPDGTCGDPTGSPCDDRLEEPQCQQISCDEVQGCRPVEPIREGLPCDDGDPSTKNDHCVDGACVGEPKCQCDTDSRCCDGCMPRNEGKGCRGPSRPSTCQGGECKPTNPDNCECTNIDHPCCNGCQWTPGRVCKTRVYDDCRGGCGGEVVSKECDSTCVPGRGTTYDCEIDQGSCSTKNTESCELDERCKSGSCQSVRSCR